MHTAYSSYEAKVPVTFSVDNACVEPPPGYTVTVGQIQILPPTSSAAAARARPAKPHKVAAKPNPKSDWDLLERPVVQASPYAPKATDKALAAKTCAAGVTTQPSTTRPSHKPFPISGESPRGGLLVPIQRITKTLAGSPLSTTPLSDAERDATTWLPYAVAVANRTPNDREAREALCAALDPQLAAGFRESFAHARLNDALAHAIGRVGSTRSIDSVFRLLTGATYDRLAAERAKSATAVATR